MVEPPETHYARCDGLSIAYQCFGKGEHTMVVAPGILSHLEAIWSIPAYARFYRRVANFVRVARFDRRGTGLSDRLATGVLPTLEQRAEDFIAVMDAIGVKEAVAYGSGDGGHVAALVAANFPDRVRALVLFASWARLKPSADYPHGRADAEEIVLPMVRQHWGSDIAPYGLKWFAPSVRDDPEWRRTLARLQRLVGPPATAVSLYRSMYAADIRCLLSRIAVPTLVLHNKGDRTVAVEHGRYLAAQIARAQLIELDGKDNMFFVDEANADVFADCLERFITGHVPEHEPGCTIASVLFTDIVGSTSTAFVLGDRRWADLLEKHEDTLRRQVAAYGGRVIDMAGDGVFAVFSVPRRAIQCALSIQEMLRPLQLQVRAGIHTGEVESRGARVSGVTVHIGARIVAAAQPHEILVSRTVKDLVVGSGITFEERGMHLLKGLPDPWELFCVVPESPRAPA